LLSKVLLISIPATQVEQASIEKEYWYWHFALKTKLVYNNLDKQQLTKLGDVENQNIGLLSIAHFLRKNDVEVEYIAPSLKYKGIEREKEFFSDVLERVNNFKPQFIGFSANTCNIPIACNYSKLIKCLYPNIKTVIGGAHANGSESELINELLENFDYVVKGWGELPFLNILKSQVHNNGICFKENNEIFEYPINSYKVPNFPEQALDLFNVEELPGARVFTSLGCRQGKKCIFCADINNGSLTQRSEEDIINEILYFYEQKKTRYFYLGDENFFQNKQRALSILNKIYELKIDIIIGLQSRVEDIDEECIRKLQEIKICTEIQYGIESSSQEILNISRKGLRVDRVKEVCKLTKKYGINVLGYFLVGLPGETYKTAESTISMIIDMISHGYMDFAEYRIVVPFPISDMWNNSDKYKIKILNRDWSKYRAENPPIFDLETLSSNEIYNIYLNGLKRITDCYKQRYLRDFGEDILSPTFLSEVTEAGF